MRLENYEFLDVSIRRLTKGKLETTGFRKETNADKYMNWNSHVTIQWKIVIFKNLLKRSVFICSDQPQLQKEVDYLRKAFVTINDYLSKTAENIKKKKTLISLTNHRPILLNKRNKTSVISSVIGKAKHLLIT